MKKILITGGSDLLNKFYKSFGKSNFKIVNIDKISNVSTLKIQKILNKKNYSFIKYNLND